MLQVLYKLKTAKVFERARGKEEKPSTDKVEEDPFAIQTLSWCPESRMLCVAGVSAHVIVYRFSKQEVTTEAVQVGQIPSVHMLFLAPESTQCCLTSLCSAAGGEDAVRVQRRRLARPRGGADPHPAHPGSFLQPSGERASGPTLHRQQLLRRTPG